MGIDHPAGIVKNIVPIVMAGVLGIYGLIVSVIITQSVSMPGGDGANTYSTYNGYTHVSRSECPVILSKFDRRPSYPFLVRIKITSLQPDSAVDFRAWPPVGRLEF
jgi:hypothetical protein